MIKKIACLAMALVMVFTVTAVDVSALDGEPTPENETNVEGTVATQEVEAAEVSAITLEATKGLEYVSLSWDITGEAAEGTQYEIIQVVNSESKVLATTTDKKFVVEKDWEGNDLVAQEYTFKVAVKDSDPLVASSEVSATPDVYPGNIKKVSNLRTIAGSKVVTVKWDKLRDEKGTDLVDGYNVYRNGVLIETFIPSKPEATECTRNYSQAERTSASFVVAGFIWKDSEKTLKKEGVRSEAVTGAPVSALYVTFKAKAKKPFYKGSKGKKKAGYLAKNQTATAQGFVCGRLRVMIGNNIYYFPRVYAKNISMKYVRGANYTQDEANNFVNTRGTTSRTGYMVWLSLYQQHIYFFRGGAGHWNCINDWEVSTGEAKSATATGEWVIKKKYKKRRGLWYWSNFYSGVSLHSWANPKCFGVPHSGGCVRMTKAQAQWAWSTLPLGTKVLTY